MTKKKKRKVHGAISAYMQPVAFYDALEDAFAEPGMFDVEHRDGVIILTTKNGTRIHAFAREIIYAQKWRD